MSIQIGLPAVRRAAASVGLGALFVLCWSSGFIGAKLGAGVAPVTTVLMWRFLPLAVLLLPVLCRSVGDGVPIAEMRRQVLVGVLSQSGYLLSVYVAIGLGVSTGTTALIDGSQPLVVAALAGPLLGVAVRGRQWWGLGIGVLAVVLVTGADAVHPSTVAPPWAYAIPFLGMLCLVAATFLERRGVPLPPLRVLAIHCVTSAVIFTGVAFANGTAVPPDSGGFWLALLWLIVLATFGGYGLYWGLIRRIGVTPVNTLMFLVPPVTGVWGAVMFGEPLTLVTGVGFGLAIVAVLLVVRAPGRTAGSWRKADDVQ
ncbi:DMT family transporter [Leucobacter sp. 7(1)]|uniref:DMT family transporter n=1 Tax=Leucobacter sp. 7(1) TaxID=1255613 RepID=UPI000B34E76D|nr:DMT family transporter [Leucobacter sp. 7(1)]